MNIQNTLNLFHSFRYQIIIASSVILILIITLLFIFTQREDNVLNQSGNAQIANETQDEITPPPSERFVSFTGYMDEETDSIDTQNAVEQANNLRENSPISTSSFQVTFNYKTLKFDIVLNQDDPNAIEVFNEWKVQNYPSVPTDQLNFSQN